MARHGRLATVPGRSGKPTIIVTQTLGIYIGNEVVDSLQLCGTELFGFNTGNYEVKPATEKRHTLGVAWRLKADTDLIADNKVLTPVCNFLQKVANSKGLAEITIPDHTISPMLHTPVFWLCNVFWIIFFLQIVVSNCNFRFSPPARRY